MSRENLIRMLEAYRAADEKEEQMRRRTLRFVRRHPNCFERSLVAGHITGSAWVIDRAQRKALLTHHRKLDRWLQLGGHADGETDVLRVALREAYEESGLTHMIPLAVGIFDVDIHRIPAQAGVPAHLHYDIRFLLEASSEEPLRMSEESRALAWVELDRVGELNTDASVLRLASKAIRYLDQDAHKASAPADQR